LALAATKIPQPTGTPMAIPYWLIGLVILAVLAAFMFFAFRQGMKVKRDRNKNYNHDDWARPTDSGY
jgi:hypothetical protein